MGDGFRRLERNFDWLSRNALVFEGVEEEEEEEGGLCEDCVVYGVSARRGN